MGSINKKEVLAQLKERFPKASELIIHYFGAADNFDSFSSLEVLDEDGNTISEYEGKNYQEQYEIEKEFVAITQDIIFDIMDNRAKNQPNFNDDGSEGTVTFDLVDRVIILANVYLEDTTEYTDEDGNEIEYDEVNYEEHPAPPEVF